MKGDKNMQQDSEVGFFEKAWIKELSKRTSAFRDGLLKVPEGEELNHASDIVRFVGRRFGLKNIEESIRNSYGDITVNDVMNAVGEMRHGIWSKAMKAKGWVLGEYEDFKEKKHPALMPFLDALEKGVVKVGEVEKAAVDSLKGVLERMDRYEDFCHDAHLTPYTKEASSLYKFANEFTQYSAKDQRDAIRYCLRGNKGLADDSSLRDLLNSVMDDMAKDDSLVRDPASGIRSFKEVDDMNSMNRKDPNYVNGMIEDLSLLGRDGLRALKDAFKDLRRENMLEKSLGKEAVNGLSRSGGIRR